MNNSDTLKNIRVVLNRPSHPGNIGAAARAMKTMGLNALALVQPRDFPHADADARASGARELLQSASIHATLSSALGDCVLAVATSSRHRELRHDTVDVRTAASAAVAMARDHPVAIVFGNERTGLNADEASLCQLWAYIPTAAAYASLNLAAAVQIVAYELRLAAAPVTALEEMEFTPATIEQVERLYEHFAEVMSRVGFYDAAHPKRLLLRLRRLLARARLEEEEVNILRGFLKAVNACIRDRL